MTNHDKTNRRIAEAMGWKWEKYANGGGLWHLPDGKTRNLAPGCTTDANAALEAARVIMPYAFSLSMMPLGDRKWTCTHVMSRIYYTADTAALALTAMCEAVLNERDVPEEPNSVMGAEEWETDANK